VSEIDRIVENYPQGRVAPKVTLRLQKQIAELNGDTDRGSIATFVEKLPIADSKFIRTFLKENVPSLDLTKKVIAPSGEETKVDIVFGVEFFRPFF